MQPGKAGSFLRQRCGCLYRCPFLIALDEQPKRSRRYAWLHFPARASPLSRRKLTARATAQVKEGAELSRDLGVLEAPWKCDTPCKL